MSMESSKKETPPCSSDAAACNPAAPVRPPVADPDPDSYTNENWPRFLVIKSRDDKSILKHNLFIIAKAIEGIAGKPKETKALTKAGLLLIEVDKKHYATNLLKATLLHDIPVEITAHRWLNSSKGVITCHNIDGVDDDEIKKNLKESDQNVQDVFRLSTFKNGQKTKSNTFVITFSVPTLPEKLYVGHYRVNVRLYIPNPRRCFNCHQFQHTAKFCKNEAVCAKCGQSGHGENECQSDAVCVNCKGTHKASSKACPQWKKEKSIVEYKYTHNVSFQAARTVVENEGSTPTITNNANATYSSVLTNSSKPSKSEMGTQTELTWPEKFTSPVLTADCLVINDKSVQSANENMEIETETLKRIRGDSSSSNEDDLPTIKKQPPQKKGNHLKNFVYKLEKSGVSLNRGPSERAGSSKESVAPQEPEASQEPVSPSPSGNSTTEGAEGGEWTKVSSSSSKNYASRGRSRHRPAAAPPPPPASRSGSNASSRSETRRSRSPVKPP